MPELSKERFRKLKAASVVRVIATDSPSALVLKGPGDGEAYETRVSGAQWYEAHEAGSIEFTCKGETVSLDVAQVAYRGLKRDEQGARPENVNEASRFEDEGCEGERRTSRRPSLSKRSLKVRMPRVKVTVAIERGSMFKPYQFDEAEAALAFLYRMCPKAQGLTGSALSDIGGLGLSGRKAVRLYRELAAQGRCVEMPRRRFKPAAS